MMWRSSEHLQRLLRSAGRAGRSGTVCLAAGLALAALAGCTSQLADVAEPAATPARPAAAPAYPTVNDMPAHRDTDPMTEAERQKISDELSAARDRQKAETSESTASTSSPAQ